ncbi:hypothetical protein CKQ90_34545, partial [Klebsiella pneumoniae]
QFAIGVWIAAFSLGSAIGPLVGGVLLEFFHWGAVFWLNVPVMLLTLQFAIGVWIAAFSLGSAIGPLVGGVLLEFFHWGA